MGKELSDKFYEEKKIKESSLKYFGGDEIATDSWINKYALKDSEDKVYELNPDQMHRRIAKEIARIETKYGGENSLSENQVYDLIKDFKYIIPGGSNMSGIGNNMQFTSLSNCFVVGSGEDSYGGILRVDQEQVQLMKRRGGVGHDLSHIRPNDTPVKNSALTSTGVIPFAERYSNSTKEVAQGGRRGALMLSLSVKHPDSEAFVDAKIKKGKIDNANISLRIDDDFMKAVEKESKYIQKFPIDSENPTHTKEINAKELWEKITHNAWNWAEPGILFWDTIKRESIPDGYGKDWETVSTNPCGEIPLCPYDSCRLLSLNLYNYVENPFTDKAKFNEEKFKQHAKYAQRIMDDIIDLEIEKIDNILEKIVLDPESEETKFTEKRLWERIKEKTIKGRRTGIGITAEADMLAALGFTYGTKEATEFATEVQKSLALSVYEGSVDLAEERGAFEIYDSEKEKDNPFIQRIANENPELYTRMIEKGRRNLALLTIAPTGTVSIVAKTSSGIEPIFDVAYERRRRVNKNEKGLIESNVYVDENGESWEKYMIFHPKFEVWLENNNYNIEEVKKIANQSLSIQEKEKELKSIVEKSPYFKATSKDVNWIEKVKMQGSIQKWVDHSISATTNIPEETSEETVSQIYLEAWKAGCKGMTIYRDGCKREGIFNSGKKKEGLEEITLVQMNVEPHPRLDIKPQAIKYKITREHDKLHLIPTSDLYVDDKNKKAYFLPAENFHNRLFPGSDKSADFTTIGFLLSEVFESENPNYLKLVKTLQSFSTDESEGIGPNKLKSTQHGIGLVLEDYFLRNGILEKDKNTGMLYQSVLKKDLRKIDPKKDKEEYKKIMSQVRIGDNEEEIKVSGQNGKLDFKFECPECGGKEYHFESGCDNPICSCGWSNPEKSCG